MACKRSEQADETRQKLIETAKRAFSENGYKAASVRSISKSIGVSESLLYHYFPNGKRELLAEVIRSELPAFHQSISESNIFDKLENIPVTEAFEMFFSKLTDFVNAHIDIIRISILEKEVRDYLYHDEMSGYLRAAEKFFVDFLEKRKASGEIDCSDCKSAALIAKAMILNNILFCVLGISISEEIPIENRREVMAEILKVRNVRKEV